MSCRAGRTEWAMMAFAPNFATKDLYQVQERLKKLCEFSTVWADLAIFSSTETAEQKLKYATFEGVFVSFSG